MKDHDGRKDSFHHTPDTIKRKGSDNFAANPRLFSTPDTQQSSRQKADWHDAIQEFIATNGRYLFRMAQENNVSFEFCARRFQELVSRDPNQFFWWDATTGKLRVKSLGGAKRGLEDVDPPVSNAQSDTNAEGSTTTRGKRRQIELPDNTNETDKGDDTQPKNGKNAKEEDLNGARFKNSDDIIREITTKRNNNHKKHKIILNDGRAARDAIDSFKQNALDLTYALASGRNGYAYLVQMRTDASQLKGAKIPIFDSILEKIQFDSEQSILTGKNAKQADLDGNVLKDPKRLIKKITNGITTNSKYSEMTLKGGRTAEDVMNEFRESAKKLIQEQEDQTNGYAHLVQMRDYARQLKQDLKIETFDRILEWMEFKAASEQSTLAGKNAEEDDLNGALLENPKHVINQITNGISYYSDHHKSTLKDGRNAKDIMDDFKKSARKLIQEQKDQTNGYAHLVQMRADASQLKQDLKIETFDRILGEMRFRDASEQSTLTGKDAKEDDLYDVRLRDSKDVMIEITTGIDNNKIHHENTLKNGRNAKYVMDEFRESARELIQAQDAQTNGYAHLVQMREDASQLKQDLGITRFNDILDEMRFVDASDQSTLTGKNVEQAADIDGILVKNSEELIITISAGINNNKTYHKSTLKDGRNAGAVMDKFRQSAKNLIQEQKAKKNGYAHLVQMRADASQLKQDLKIETFDRILGEMRFTGIS